jgi:hypothetical protein
MAVYTPIADVTVKLAGASLWGFALLPVCATFLLGVVAWQCSRDEEPARSTRFFEVNFGQSILAFVFALTVVGQVVPIQWNEGIFWGTPEIDWRSRLGVIHALARDGLPAANPFFDPTSDTKLFFYYGFFLEPAGVVRTLNGDPISVLAVMVFVLAMLMASLVIGLGRLATGVVSGGWAAGLMLFVTGFDLLPVLGLIARNDEPMSIEWWNPAQITAMTAFPVWVPHHTLAVLEILVAHFLLWQAESQRRQATPLAIVVLAFVLAGAGMSSTYVAMLGFVSVFLHGLARTFSDPTWQAGRGAFGCTVLGGILCLPFYYQLSHHDRYEGPTLAPIIRPCPGEEPLHENLAHSLHVSKPLALFLVRLLGLIPQYFIELGVLFFVLMYWRRTGLGPPDSDGLWRRLGTMVITAFVIGSVLVSVRTWNCDLNWRIMHPVQIVLAGVAGSFWMDFRAKRRPIVEWAGFALAVMLGLAGTAYDLFRARFDYCLRKPEQARWAELSHRASRTINQVVNHHERIAIRPSQLTDRSINGFWGHYLRQHLVLTDTDFNAFPYGPSAHEVRAMIADFERIFSEKTNQETRLRLLARYRVRTVVLDASSAIFSRPLVEVFGEHAQDIASDAQKDWKVVRLSEN